jgi:hypothetical protein
MLRNIARQLGLGNSETAPELTRFDITSDGHTSEVVVTPAISDAQKGDFNLIMRSIVDIQSAAGRKATGWAEVPQKAIHTISEDGESESRYHFNTTNHFGVFQDLPAEIGMKVLFNILERDGAKFDFAAMSDRVTAQLPINTAQKIN